MKSSRKIRLKRKKTLSDDINEYMNIVNPVDDLSNNLEILAQVLMNNRGKESSKNLSVIARSIEKCTQGLLEFLSAKEKSFQSNFSVFESLAGQFPHLLSSSISRIYFSLYWNSLDDLETSKEYLNKVVEFIEKANSVLILFEFYMCMLDCILKNSDLTKAKFYIEKASQLIKTILKSSDAPFSEVQRLFGLFLHYKRALEEKFESVKAKESSSNSLKNFKMPKNVASINKTTSSLEFLQKNLSIYKESIEIITPKSKCANPVGLNAESVKKKLNSISFEFSASILQQKAFSKTNAVTPSNFTKTNLATPLNITKTNPATPSNLTNTNLSTPSNLTKTNPEPGQIPEPMINTQISLIDSNKTTNVPNQDPTRINIILSDSKIEKNSLALASLPKPSIEKKPLSLVQSPKPPTGKSSTVPSPKSPIEKSSVSQLARPPVPSLQIPSRVLKIRSGIEASSPSFRFEQSPIEVSPCIKSECNSKKPFEYSSQKTINETEYKFKFIGNFTLEIIAKTCNQTLSLDLDEQGPFTVDYCEQILKRITKIDNCLVLVSNRSVNFRYFKDNNQLILENFIDSNEVILYRTSIIRNQELYQISMTRQASHTQETILVFKITSGKDFSQTVKIDLATAIQTTGLQGSQLGLIGSYISNHVIFVNPNGICYLDFSVSKFSTLKFVIKIQAMFRGKIERRKCNFISWTLIFKDKIAISKTQYTILLFKQNYLLLLRLVKKFEVLGINLSLNAVNASGYYEKFDKFVYNILFTKIQITNQGNEKIITGLEKYKATN
jgi:hypothetical protein